MSHSLLPRKRRITRSRLEVLYKQVEVEVQVFVPGNDINVQRQQQQEVTNLTLEETVYEGMLNLLLCHFCSDKFTKHDEQIHHILPKYMVEGLLTYS